MLNVQDTKKKDQVVTASAVIIKETHKSLIQEVEEKQKSNNLMEDIQ